MSYKTFLYKLASMLSPSFYKEISELIPTTHETLTIFDIGFYNGEFSKKIIENLDFDSSKQITYVYSFDPNNKINRRNFEEFAELNKIHWKHFTYALGDKNSEENFTILKHFPSSGSSVNNILINSMWLKSRRFIFSPFTKESDSTETFEVIQKTLDSVDLNIKNIDILKIDVEGYSYEVLQGAKETINKFNPIIQLEVLSRKDEYDKSREDIIMFLNDLDYKLVNTKKHFTTHIFSDIICSDLLFTKNKKVNIED